MEKAHPRVSTSAKGAVTLLDLRSDVSPRLLYLVPSLGHEERVLQLDRVDVLDQLQTKSFDLFWSESNFVACRVLDDVVLADTGVVERTEPPRSCCSTTQTGTFIMAVTPLA